MISLQIKNALERLRKETPFSRQKYERKCITHYDTFERVRKKEDNRKTTLLMQNISGGHYYVTGIYTYKQL